MQTLKTIYFDLGNVLVFFSREKMAAQLSALSGLTPQELNDFFYARKWLEKYETGKVGTEEIYRGFQALAPRSFSLYEMMDAACNIFSPNLELWPLLDALKKENYRLILLSNTSECHFNKVYSDYPIFHYFDHKILSYEVGAWKPDPQIFHKALFHARCQPEECFYTDDMPDFIHAARKVGLPGEIYTDVATLRNHLIERGCGFLRCR